MQTPERWLTVFGERQEQAKSPGLYWVALLSLLLGTVTLLWSLPVPDEFRLVSPMLNWGSAFLMASLVYYFIISLTLGLDQRRANRSRFEFDRLGLVHRCRTA